MPQVNLAPSDEHTKEKIAAHSFALLRLCVRVPHCGMIAALIWLTFSSFALAQSTKPTAPATKQEAPPQAPAQVAKAIDWPMTRGNLLSSGAFPDSVGDTFETEWEFKYPTGAFEAGPIVVAGNKNSTVYVAGINVDVKGKLFAIDLESGKEKWSFESEDGFVSSPAWREGHVFVGNMLGKLYCIDDKGKPKWETNADGEISSGANFHGPLVLWGSQDATLYALERKSGELKWTHTIDDQIQCGATIADGKCFLAGCDSKFHIVDLKKGGEAGTVEVGSPTGTTPAALGKNVYFGTEEGTFLCIDFKSQKIQWQYQDPEGASPIRSSASVTEKFVIFGSRNRKVTALNPKNGETIWTTTLKAKIDASPIIAGNRVYAASTDGRLYTLDLSNGEILWQKQFNGSFLGSPAIVSGNRPRLVVATERGVVYCLKSKK